MGGSGDGGSYTAARRRGLHEPVSGLAGPIWAFGAGAEKWFHGGAGAGTRRSWPWATSPPSLSPGRFGRGCLVCPWFAPVATSGRWRLSPPAWPLLLPPLVLGCLLCSRRSRFICHGETTMGTAQPWWRMLVGGVFGGARWIVWSRGWLVVRRNPCRLVRHRRGDVCGHRRAFLKGVGLAPSPAILYIPGGNPRTCPDNSVVGVAVLLEGVTWYAAVRSARSVVEFSGGRSGCGSSSFSLIRRCSHLFLFCFLFHFFLGVTVVLLPQHLSLAVSELVAL